MMLSIMFLSSHLLPLSRYLRNLIPVSEAKAV